MAANWEGTTFEKLWKKILLYAPDCPLPLAQEFVNTAYSRALAYSEWSALRKESEFVIADTYDTGTVTVTQGSTAVTGSGTTFTAAMVGRQFIVEGIAPFYTVATAPTSTSLTLDREFGGTTAAGASYDIVQVYQDVPSDFDAFLSIVDIENNWQVRRDVTQEMLDRWDARRSVTTTPRVLAPAAYDSSGAARYELWPRSLAAKTLPFRYRRKVSLMSASADSPIFPIRGDVLRNGALAELAKWPGTKLLANPYNGPGTHMMHEQAFIDGLNKIQREDEEIAQTAIQYVQDTSLPWAPIDARFIQQHDVFV